MSSSWLDVSAVSSDLFPLQVFGYPEESPDDSPLIYHVVLLSADDGREVPTLPKQRMRMVVIAADGRRLIGREKTAREHS